MSQIHGADARIPSNEDRLKWFREAKFGMFIHWGLYAQLEGYWKGKPIRGIGEQIMRFAEISPEEYKPLAADFNPVKFDAREWVRICKAAGMKYLVITSKHHDGFAMFRSRVSDFNIVDATPFGRDPLAELAEACRDAGIKLCFYYSHYQDWTEPGAEHCWTRWQGTYGPEDGIFEDYMNRKALPQVAELLTGYGPIGLIWYDTPGHISKYNAHRFAELVHALQPECLVGPRVGQGEGDYIGYGDNMVPNDTNPLPWESPATLNDTWGFKRQDTNWKSTETLLQLLISIVSKGGNYLLNVGPTKEGVIPPESVERLEEIGAWLARNGEAIYESRGCALNYTPEWGAITAREGRAYLHLFNWTSTFVLHGVRNPVKRAFLLATGDDVAFTQEYDKAADIHTLTLALPAAAPDKYASVIALDIDGELDMDQTILPAGDTITLPGHLAAVETDEAMSSYRKGPLLGVDRNGVLVDWFRPMDYATWVFKVSRPGRYAIDMNTYTENQTSANEAMPWEGGHVFTLRCNEQTLEFTVTDDERQLPRNLFHRQRVVTHIGETLEFDAPGTYSLTLRPVVINNKLGLGAKLESLKLRRL